MPLLSPVETIKILLPGLLALTSILVVVITFLLERYIPVKPLPEGDAYCRLAWFMTAALIVGGVNSIFSLLFILGIGDIIGEKASLLYFAVILTLFILCVLLVIVGTIITVKHITKVK